MATPFSYAGSRRGAASAPRLARWLDAAGAPVILVAIVALMLTAGIYAVDPAPSALRPPLHALQAEL